MFGYKLNIMSKTAIVIISDPKSNTDESLARVLNAMAAAYDYKSSGEDVKIVFTGTGTRWPSKLQKEDHMGHKIYKEIEDVILGVSAACSQVFGADPSGLDLIQNNPVPGTPGLPSLVQLQKDGYNIITF